MPGSRATWACVFFLPWALMPSCAPGDGGTHADPSPAAVHGGPEPLEAAPEDRNPDADKDFAAASRTIDGFVAGLSGLPAEEEYRRVLGKSNTLESVGMVARMGQGAPREHFGTLLDALLNKGRTDVLRSLLRRKEIGAPHYGAIARELAKRHDAEALGILLRNCTDESFDQKMEDQWQGAGFGSESVSALAGFLGGESTSETAHRRLQEIVTKSRFSQLRGHAAAALGSSPRKETREVLQFALCDDGDVYGPSEDGSVGEYALRSLVQLLKKTQTDALKEVREVDPRELICIREQPGLEIIGNRVACDRILKAAFVKADRVIPERPEDGFEIDFAKQEALFLFWGRAEAGKSLRSSFVEYAGEESGTITIVYRMFFGDLFGDSCIHSILTVPANRKIELIVVVIGAKLELDCRGTRVDLKVFARSKN